MRLRQHPKTVKIQKRLFQCTVCGTVSPATKYKGITIPGHLKTMYCRTCKDDTDHIQIE